MREIQTGKIYKHFKGNYFKVLFIGYDSEHTDKDGNPIKLVGYESSHDGKIWIRPYDNFLEKVDKEKYPNAEQEYRFELVD